MAARGGVASASELGAAGFSRRRIALAVAEQKIQRIRIGWFALPDADSDIVRAIRAGGSLTCISAAAAHGLWAPYPRSLHISLRRGDRHLRHPDTGAALDERESPLIVHWNGDRAIDHSRGLIALPGSLVEVLRCQPVDLAFAVVESALRQRRLDADESRSLWRATSRDRRHVLQHADHRADSGSESVFRFRMLLLGVVMRSQVEIGGVGRVDFLIGDRLLVEIDSQGHHGTREQRLRDLRRDAIASGLGFICLRFDYDQIMNDWSTVEATVMAIIGRGEHLTSPRA